MASTITVRDLVNGGGVQKVTVGRAGPQGPKGDTGDALANIGADGTQIVADSTEASGISWIEPIVVNALDPQYGVPASGDTTAALQAIADGLTDGATLFLPGPRVYEVTGFDITNSDVTVVFGGGAWLAPTSGYGMKITGARSRVYDPRIRLNTGTTATRGLWYNRARRNKVYNPVIWAFDEIPSGFVCIDVDDNAYWTEIFSPDIRKDSGSIVSNFAKGVRFFKESNASLVWGGNFAHCDKGIEVDGSNTCGHIGSVFETCTTGIEWIEPTSTGNGAGGVAWLGRYESTTNPIVISQSLALSWPIMVSSIYSSVSPVVSNPNSQPVYGLNSDMGINIRGLDQSISLRNGASRIRDAAGQLWAEANGNIVLNADMDNNGTGDISFRFGASERGKWRRSDQVLEVWRGLQLGTGTAPGNAYLQGFEQTSDPAAPPADGWRIFGRDNGSGKTELCVRFATGAVQVIKTEP